MDARAEVLRLLKEGLRPAEIARRLGISKPAVSKHIKALREAGQLSEVVTPSRETNPAPVNRQRGAPPGNRNAVVTGEYETLWDDALSPRERAALRAAGDMPTIDQVTRQIGLIDVRIGRLLERIRQTREALAVGVELQIDGRTETDGSMGDSIMDITATRFAATREVLDRQEKAMDRLTQRRERALALRTMIELKLRPPAGDDEPGRGARTADLPREERLALIRRVAKRNA